VRGLAISAVALRRPLPVDVRDTAMEAKDLTCATNDQAVGSVAPAFKRVLIVLLPADLITRPLPMHC
jgi:hypothetical protein